jgi:hypothetical protein
MKNPFDFAQPPERDNNCPEFLRTPRAIMHWRYQNLRMLMHRPMLLATTLRKTPYTSLSAEEKVAVARCRLIAGQAIADIDASCPHELIAGWNAVWLMFQAAMVPLVSLFARLSSAQSNGLSGKNKGSNSPNSRSSGSDSGSVTAPTGGDDDEDKWRAQIEQALSFFERMRPWSVAAKKSKDVVERLYEASKHVADYQTTFHHTQAFSLAGISPPQQQQLQHLEAPTGQLFSSPLHMPAPLQFSPPSLPMNIQDGNAGTWGLSPHGEQRMNVFWDDMMWDTFPAVTDSPTLGPSFNSADFDWGVLGGQSNDPSQSNWAYWAQGPHENMMEHTQ